MTLSNACTLTEYNRGLLPHQLVTIMNTDGSKVMEQSNVTLKGDNFTAFVEGLFRRHNINFAFLAIALFLISLKHILASARPTWLSQSLSVA